MAASMPPLGYPLTAPGHGPRPGDDLHVGLLVHQEGGRLAERRVVLHEQYQHGPSLPPVANAVVLTRRGAPLLPPAPGPANRPGS